MWEEWMMEDLRKQEEVVFPPPLFPYTTHKYLGQCDARCLLESVTSVLF